MAPSCAERVTLAPVHVRVRASGKSTPVTAPMAAPSLLLEQQ
jgi:hypothetical protein